ncbi:MAG: sulfatase/phosphatase domain-containing protein, partial [Planctomycetota bacterium]
LCYQADVFPTLAELAGAEVPEEVDGLSIVPTLIGAKRSGRTQEQHDYLYWEHRAQVAVRIDDWKGVYSQKSKRWELYDLAKDPSESKDVASSHADLISQMQKIADASHEPQRLGSYTTKSLHERDRAAKFGLPK